MNIIFYLGKGGVGKSSLSILSALELSQNQFTVALISLDRAHNLFDILQADTDQLPAALTVLEPDIDRFIQKYLQNTEVQMRRSYSYLTALNLEKHFKILRLAPGLEEYGLLLAFRHYLEKFKKYNYIIFDMPPTAVALKFFGLPSVSLIWLKQLLQLRDEILHKKEIISSVKWGKKEIETDKIKKNLLEQKSEYESLLNIFRNTAQCYLNIVSTPDSVSLAESKRIIHHLHELHIPVHRLAINKFSAEKAPPHQNSFLAFQNECVIPRAEYPLIGLETLRNYLRKNEQFLNKLVK